MSNREFFRVITPLKHNGITFKPDSEFTGDPPEKFEKDTKAVTTLIKIGALRKESVVVQEPVSSQKGEAEGSASQKSESAVQITNEYLQQLATSLGEMKMDDLIAAGKKLDSEFDEPNNDKRRERLKELIDKRLGDQQE